MIRYALIVVYLLLSLSLSAQTGCYFIKAYDHQLWDDSGERVIVNRDGEIVVLGRAFGATTDAIWLLWLNECGDTIRTRRYTLSPGTGGERGSGLFQNSDGTYSVHGDQHYQATGTASSFLLYIAENGDSLDHKVYNSNVNERTRASINVKGKEFYGAGNYTTGSSAIILYKTDTSGNLLWAYDYANSYVNTLYDLELTSSGDFLLSGRTRDGQSSNLDLFLIKTDSIGNFAWRKVYGNAGTESLGKMDQFSNGDVLLIGGYEPNPFNTSLFHSLLIRVDSSGNQLWRRESDNLNNIVSFNDGLILPDETIVLAGGYVPADSVNKAYVTITKLDDNGNEFWRRKIDYLFPQESLSAIEIKSTDESDILIVGTAVFFTPWTNTRNDLLIIKTDSCGFSAKDTTRANFDLDSVQDSQVWLENLSSTTCSQLWLFGDGDSSTFWNPMHTYPDTGDYTVSLITRAANTTDTFTKIISVRPVAAAGLLLNEQAKFQIYPNPTTEYLHLNSNSLESIQVTLFSLDGKQVLIHQVQSDQPIDVSHLNPGLYIYLAEGNGKTARGKVIIK